MTITRVESLTYGVEDMGAAMRFFEDWGLEKLDGGAAGATFRTRENQIVRLRPADDPSLPAAPDRGATLREAVWGVDTADALQAIAGELGRDREVGADPDGTLHSRDDSGFAVAFGLADAVAAPVDAPAVNVNRSVNRVNRRVVADRRARPIRIGHIVYLVPEEGREAAVAFYRDRLGFRLSDRIERLGAFLRCEGAWDHHSLFLMWVRKTVTAFDHAAFELPDFDDVFVGGLHMKAQGWQSHDGPGRQATGSHVYWHFECPAGGTTEYFTDMDRFDETWEPGAGAGHTTNTVWRLDTA